MKQFMEESSFWNQPAQRNYVGKPNNPLPGVPVNIINNSGHGIFAGQILAIDKPFPELFWGVQGPQGSQGIQGNQSQNRFNTEFMISSIIFDCKMVDENTRSIVVSTGNIPAGGSGIGYVAGNAVAVVRVDDQRRLNTNSYSPDAQFGYCDFIPNCPNLVLSDGGFKIIWMGVDYEGPQGYQGAVGTQGYQTANGYAQYVTAIVDLSTRGGRVDYTVYNSENEIIPDYSFVEVDGLADNVDGPQGYYGRTIYKVKKPTADSLGNVLCVTKGIEGFQFGRASMLDKDGGIRIRYYDATVPSPGDMCGTTSGGYQATVGNTGFVILGAYPVGPQDSVPEGNQAEALLHIRPFSVGATQLKFPVRNTDAAIDIPAKRFIEIWGWKAGYQDGATIYPEAYMGRNPTATGSLNCWITLETIYGAQANTGYATYDPFTAGIELEYNGSQGNQQGVQGYQGWQGTEVPQFGRRVGPMYNGIQGPQGSQSVAWLGIPGWVVLHGYQYEPGPQGVDGPQAPGEYGWQGAQGVVFVRPQW